MIDKEILEKAIELLGQFDGNGDRWTVSMVGGAKEQLESVLEDLNTEES